mmetsp:Transcript_28921/g.40323  ORF Transcript_28921/g.40323 Transcript_28921/m.40323 type:complete len:248 (-) Transcript_28921:107-850(-)
MATFMNIRKRSLIGSSLFHLERSLLLLLLQLYLLSILPSTEGRSSKVLRGTVTPPLLDVPTYSLATVGNDGKTCMNILTYATPVGIKPERIWAISIYKGSQTHDNFVIQKRGVLQLLRRSHSPLVRLLGGKSGRDVDKKGGCAKLGFSWIKQQTTTIIKEDQIMLLPGCMAYIKVTLQGDLIDAGVHSVALCKVEEMLVLNEDDNVLERFNVEDPILNTRFLRDLGIISEAGRVIEPGHDDINRKKE